MNEYSTDLYANVILPLALPKLYTYYVPDELREQIKPGQRAVVQFGKSKLYTALIRNLHQDSPGYRAKNILSLLEYNPLVNEIQFELWEWISSYYLCTLGEVMIAALPSGLKLHSETKIILNPAFSGDFTALGEKEFLLTEALKLKNNFSISEASLLLKRKNIFPLVKSLIEKKAVFVEEAIIEKYKPKYITYVQLSKYAKDEEWLQNAFQTLEQKAPKQLELLMTFMKLSFERKDSRQNGGEKGITKTELLKNTNVSNSVLDQLLRKDILTESEVETDRLPAFEYRNNEKTILNDFQKSALEEVRKHFITKDVVLLHGVTSSGKTEIYIQLIEEALKQGKQVLYLLPEIALTTQIILRLQKHFGNSVGVYHSRFNDNERVEVWKKILPKGFSDTEGVPEHRQAGGFNVILGARSAIFLPFSNLGLVIVDEEHDGSYKQYDPAPRYNARDTAILLARFHKAKTLLGSATPSVESNYNSSAGKYGLVEIKKRFGDMHMPEIIVVDIKEETRKKLMKSHFSSILLEGIRHALEQKEQVILFQNRRGYAPFVQCAVCAWAPHCINCDVSLTYHKFSDTLRCHYCGYSQKNPSECAACGSHHLNMKGFGTEKIEDELSIFFPGTSIARMDLDTTRSKFSYRQIINDFETRKIQILVGTQMVTKGLDFDNVSTVGILNADTMLNFPDFRAFERAYQLMAQVSGRSGRKLKRGKVIVQTFHPKHHIIECVLENNYERMFAGELAERKKFNYPPFFRLIEITLKHKDIHVLDDRAENFSHLLKNAFGKRVLGPELPLIARIKNLYLKTVLLKIEKEASITEAKRRLLAVIDTFREEKQNRAVHLHIDVDPI